MIKKVKLFTIRHLPFAICYLFISACAPYVAYKKDYDFKKIKKIAVLNFDSYIGFDSSGMVVRDEIIRHLIESGITVVEREKIDKILKEREIDYKKIKKILGADAIITGSVIKYIPEKEEYVYFKDNEGNLQYEVKYFDAEVGVSARLIDTETGEIIWANTYTYESFDLEAALISCVRGLLRNLIILIRG
ncbi:MAG: hypothetical protein DRI36_02905 [Caldiserica bacterium]|nr:MAG: hypothetical protein DRI36_02905 [Caldisericota bacterium]